ncbi:hypothetical protein HUT19_39415 [Streptomyces sp. NA02950]|uniref:hypothetical protein n=1 Tax=Streptomyces sp. NA02950 TaxID=2742137 RepID=UPI001592247F|nr:hypothetical protein [Streptomyces sp. NA02950]QKV90363.1 hypothetical protein HUT19_39415 [Streptomyces sp. NA02950]
MPRRVRVRLTPLYGVLFVASGAVLLIITYLLVNRPPQDLLLFIRGGSGPSPGGGVRDGDTPPTNDFSNMINKQIIHPANVTVPTQLFPVRHAQRDADPSRQQG